jgi:predicted HicB family RNase H-like nuclease
MKYKGYTGVVELDEELGVLFGRVIGLRDVITFQGASVPEVVQAFHDSVDDYLEFCAARGESPEKPYSGQFILRVDPQLHRVMVHAAEAKGLSLNALIEETLGGAFLQGQAQRSVAGGAALSDQPPPTGYGKIGRIKKVAGSGSVKPQNPKGMRSGKSRKR